MIISINCRSLISKIDEIRDILDSNVRMLLIQETWEVQDINLVAHDNYSFECLTRRGRGGGVGIYIHKSIPYKRVNTNDLLDKDLELIQISCTLGKATYRITNVYRPPKGNYNDGIRLLSSKLEGPGKQIIMGDFNINLLAETPQQNQLISEMEDLDLFQLLSKPTRITTESMTLIDHIYTNTDKNLRYGIITHAISDHLSTFLQVGCQQPTERKSKVQRRKFTPENIENLKTLLRGEEWPEEEDKNLFQGTLEIITKNLNLACPLMECKPNKNIQKNNPWMTKGLMISRRTKDKLYEKWIKKRLLINKQNFNSYNNVYRSLIRKAKISYYHTVFNSYKTDLRKCWAHTNEMLGRSKPRKEMPRRFKVDNRDYSTSKEIADGFNAFFAGIGEKLASKFPPSLAGAMNLKNPKEAFQFTEITDYDLMKIIARMKPKKSSSFDGITNFVLKQIVNEVVSPLTRMINVSLRTGLIPDAWKIAKVVPLYKAGREDDFSNYRPISLLPVLSKVIEKVVHKQLYQFVEEHKILYPMQFGFRKRKEDISRRAQIQ